MNIDKFLKSESQKFQKGIDIIRERRKEWDIFISQSKPYFEIICNKAESYKLFEKLYVTDSTEHDYSNKSLPFITLQWGVHSAGYATIEDTRKRGIEKGCALHFGQTIDGMVACIIYPFYSDFRQPKEKYYLYKMYKKPSDITEAHLDKAIKLMFVLAHDSSFLGNPDIKDRFRIFKLKNFSAIKKIKYSEIIKPIIDFLLTIILK
jgi:hypothetical protein